MNRVLKHLAVYALFLFLMHPVYTLLVGPTTFNFDTLAHKYTLVQELLRFGTYSGFEMPKFFEGSIFLALFSSLLFSGLLIQIFLKRKLKGGRFYLFMFIFAFLFLTTGIIRLYLYEPYALLRDAQDWVMGILGFITLDKPYPLLPYLAFGMVGSTLGIALHEKVEKRLIVTYLVPIALLSLVLGIVGYVMLPQTVVGVDFTWLCKVFIEFGLFALLLTWVFPYRQKNDMLEPSLFRNVKFLGSINFITLTIYILQQPLSEILAAIFNVMTPGWNNDMGNMIMFGLFNVIVWIVIVIIAGGFLRSAGFERLWGVFAKITNRYTSRATAS
jgi:hypothetical protein